MIYAIIFIAAAALLFSRKAKADTGYSHSAQVICGDKSSDISTIDLSYDNCRYMSLRGTAKALNGTSACFNAEITDTAVVINRGKDYHGSVPAIDAELPKLRPVRVNLTVDSREAMYFPLMTGDDAYFLPQDIAFMLGVSIEMSGDAYVVDPSKPLHIDVKALENDGYFDAVNAVLAGNADTGEVYYAHNEMNPYPIASTTKLMTWVVAAEAGVKEDTVITISPEAARLSHGDDATTPMTAGMKVTGGELMRALLLPSSNESACALACHVSGSEDEFVKLMNNKAQSLGMRTARYFNSHGCPAFSQSAITSKRQNHMCAYDMFILARYIMSAHPEITGITSLKEAHLDALDIDVRNTNGMLRNMPEVIGLKTGTTNKAGCCLVTCLRVNGQNLITVLFGAENSAERVRVSEILCRYARQKCLE